MITLLRQYNNNNLIYSFYTYYFLYIYHNCIFRYWINNHLTMKYNIMNYCLLLI